MRYLYRTRCLWIIHNSPFPHRYWYFSQISSCVYLRSSSQQTESVKWKTGLDACRWSSSISIHLFFAVRSTRYAIKNEGRYSWMNLIMVGRELWVRILMWDTATSLIHTHTHTHTLHISVKFSNFIQCNLNGKSDWMSGGRERENK